MWRDDAMTCPYAWLEAGVITSEGACGLLGTDPRSLRVKVYGF